MDTSHRSVPNILIYTFNRNKISTTYDSSVELFTVRENKEILAHFDECRKQMESGKEEMFALVCMCIEWWAISETYITYLIHHVSCEDLHTEESNLLESIAIGQENIITGFV